MTEIQKIQKLAKAMELIRQAFNLTTNEVLPVMSNLYDYVIKNYPEKAKIIEKE